MKSNGRMGRRAFVGGALAVAGLGAVGTPSAAAAVAAGAPEHVPDPHRPDFGPNVEIFDPSMSASAIQHAVDAVNAVQQGNQFGTRRDALLFLPGSYDVSFDVGYYTSVAGLGTSPDDVTFNGTVNATAVGNSSDVTFWRSVENIQIVPQAGQTPMWACAQACPIRRLHLRGSAELWLVDAQNGYASGGFIADSLIEPEVYSGGQQQYLTRDSVLGGGWSNGNWNQVFSGVTGAPATSFPKPPYTTLPETPVSREKPFLFVDERKAFHVFVPALRRQSSGVTWSGGRQAGWSIPITEFFLARPSDDAATINAALAHGRHLILTPGVYSLDAPIVVTRPDTVVLGLGFPTLVPSRGTASVLVADVPGVRLAGLLLDAGPVNSPVLLQVGARRSLPPGAVLPAGGPGTPYAAHIAGAPATPRPGHASATDPVSIQDVFFRIGGATAGSATVTYEINADHVIVDNSWAWRADHGNGVGWTANTGATGLIVNGDDVTALGLFVEHYQDREIIWNGDRGTVVFLQNEMPYDPPDQAAWRADSSTDGYPALTVAPGVRHFAGHGLGSYCFFDDASLVATRAFQVPDAPGVALHSVLTFGGTGTIDHVVNDTGALATGDELSDVAVYPSS